MRPANALPSCPDCRILSNCGYEDLPNPVCPTCCWCVFHCRCEPKTAAFFERAGSAFAPEAFADEEE
jgi:hypothetical protein